MAKDPIRQELLTAKEVRQLMGMEQTTFRDFLAANPLFPRAKPVGKDKRGNDMKRWYRRQVEAYLDLMGSQ